MMEIFQQGMQKFWAKNVPVIWSLKPQEVVWDADKTQQPEKKWN